MSSARERLLAARAELAQLEGDDAVLVAPVLTEIDRAIDRVIDGRRGVSEGSEKERLSLSGERSGLLDAVLSQSPHGIIIADANGKLILQNEAAQRIWAGSTPVENIDEWAKYRAFHPDGRPFEASDWAMAQSLANGAVIEAREVHFQRFDGTYGHMIGSSAPILGLGRRVVGAVGVFVDVTRLKHVEETLRVTELQLSTTLRSIGDAVIATDGAGRITFMNAVAESLTGWSAAEAQQESLERVFEIIDEASRNPRESPVAQVIRAGTPVDLANHTLLVRKDGVEIPVDDSAAPIRDAKGNLAGVVLIFRDITKKRREEEQRVYLAAVSEQLSEASLEYEARLKRLVELAVPRLADWAAIDMAEPDGSMRRLAIAHVDPHKIAWIADLERRYPPDRNVPSGARNIVLTGRSEIVPLVTDDMLVAAAKDAEHLALIREIGLHSYIGVPLVVQGQAIGAITFATAETRRTFDLADLAFAEELARRAAAPIHNARLYREAQEALARAEAAEHRFRALAEAIPQIVWVMNAEGEHEYLSPKWYEYTGQSPGESLSERWQKALPEDDYARCMALWREVVKTGQPWQLEYQIRRADGVFRWHLGRAIPVVEGGRVLRWYGTATDIDEQRRAIRIRDDLLATVSHDLRNPLANIALSLELLEDGGKEGPELVETIKRSVVRMSTLIQDLLDIAAIEARALSINRRAAPTSALVGEAVALQRPLAKQKNVALELRTHREDTTASCDSDRILQVLGNLLGNALKFTPPSGKVVVSHEVVGDDVRIMVADNGPGIPAEQRHIVFERFWRNTKNVNAGSGLGLAICKGIVEQHGGRIWVEGNDLGGSSFVFTIPRGAAT